MIKQIMNLILVIVIFAFSANAYGEEGRYASIDKISGYVEIRKADSQEWSLAQEGMVLYENDEIRTQKASSARLLLDEDGNTGQLDVKETTRLRLNTLDKEEVSGDKKTLLDVAIGRVLIQVEKLQGESKFEVNTPTATMGVRGTKFEVVVKEKQKNK